LPFFLQLLLLIFLIQKTTIQISFVKDKNGIAVVVASITNDSRSKISNGLKVCALRFTETARANIIQAGGQCFTFDQLALLAPRGAGCMLFRGRKTARVAMKHFGPAPGTPGSLTRPYVGRRGRMRRIVCKRKIRS